MIINGNSSNVIWLEEGVSLEGVLRREMTLLGIEDEVLLSFEYAEGGEPKEVCYFAEKHNFQEKMPANVEEAGSVTVDLFWKTENGYAKRHTFYLIREK